MQLGPTGIVNEFGDLLQRGDWVNMFGRRTLVTNTPS
jgi:hypothetical protein